MAKILILSGSEAAGEKLAALCAQLPDAETTVLPDGEAPDLAAPENDWRLIVVNTPLRSGSGEKTAQYLAEHTTAGVLLIVRAGAAASLQEETARCGAAVLEKPFSRELFLAAARLGLATQTRLERLLAENRALAVRMEETKLVGRAKCVLIEHLNVTEDQAHHYIEKQAMDLRIPRSEVARGILSAYEF